MTTTLQAPTAVPSPELTEKEKLFAATNHPSLASDEFQLGDRTFKVLNLKYDDYVRFLGYLKPFLEGIGAAIASRSGVEVPDMVVRPTSINMGSLMEFCMNDLPEMARIVCAQTDPTITIDTVKELAGDPFTLSGIVFKQIAVNNIIGKVASFFAQMVPMLAKMGVLKTTQPTESTTKGTHS